MGYPEKFRIKNIGVSDTQLYKQFGNSVAVPVVQAMAVAMMEVMKHQNHLKKKAHPKEKEKLLMGKVARVQEV